MTDKPFDADTMEQFVSACLPLEDSYAALADMCNEMAATIKPEGMTLSRLQAEIVRDWFVPHFVDCMVRFEVNKLTMSLPSYANVALQLQEIQRGLQLQIAQAEAVLHDVIGIKPEIDLSTFARTAIDPKSKMIVIQVEPMKMQQYIEQTIEGLVETPVLVQGERIVH